MTATNPQPDPDDPGNPLHRPDPTPAEPNPPPATDPPPEPEPEPDPEPEPPPPPEPEPPRRRDQVLRPADRLGAVTAIRAQHLHPITERTPTQVAPQRPHRPAAQLTPRPCRVLGGHGRHATRAL